MTNLRKAKYHKEPMRTQVNNIYQTEAEEDRSDLLHLIYRWCDKRYLDQSKKLFFFFFFSFSKTKTIEDYFAY